MPARTGGAVAGRAARRGNVVRREEWKLLLIDRRSTNARDRGVARAAVRHSRTAAGDGIMAQEFETVRLELADGWHADAGAAGAAEQLHVQMHGEVREALRGCAPTARALPGAHGAGAASRRAGLADRASLRIFGGGPRRVDRSLLQAAVLTCARWRCRPLRGQRRGRRAGQHRAGLRPGVRRPLGKLHPVVLEDRLVPDSAGTWCCRAARPAAPTGLALTGEKIGASRPSSGD